MAITWPQLWVVNWHHETEHYVVESPEDLFAAALWLVRERAEQRYYPSLDDPPSPPKAPEFSREEAATRPEGWERTGALREWETYDANWENYRRTLAEAQTVGRLLRPEGNGKEAWVFLNGRRDYEGEGFYLKPLDKPWKS
jgi:hypothetical protein